MPPSGEVVGMADPCQHGSVTHRDTFRPASLDALNFLLADVRGALGPYLNVFVAMPETARAGDEPPAAEPELATVSD